jgi:hypothetical protein
MHRLRDDTVPLLQILSPLTDFVSIIAGYLSDAWSFLVLVGSACSVIVTLVGAILWFTDVNQMRGKALVLSGVILAIVVQYFIMYPPNFVLS